MKMKGSGLVEYAVPLALFAVIIGLGIYALGVNGNLLNMFLSSTNSVYNPSTQSITLNHKDVAAPIIGSPAAGQADTALGEPIIGTSSTRFPCTNAECNVDFGSFVIRGVPENFGDYINKTGSSGGTEKLSSLLEQIAQTLSQQGDTAGAAEYQKLANFGHIIADVQNLSENQAKSCKDNADPSTCLQNLMNTQYLNVRYITGVSNEIPDFYTKKMTDIYNFSIGEAQHTKINDNSLFLDRLSSHPEYAMIDTYSQIANNPKYSPELIGVTKEIMRQLNTIQMEHYWVSNCVAFSYNTGIAKLGKYDPINGTSMYGENGIAGDQLLKAGIADILNPNSSNYSNLNSSLVCIASNNGDTNDTCHNK